MKSGNKARAYALFSESFTLFLKNTYHKQGGSSGKPAADKRSLSLRDKKITHPSHPPFFPGVGHNASREKSMEIWTDKGSADPLSGDAPYAFSDNSRKFLFNNAFANQVQNLEAIPKNLKNTGYMDSGNSDTLQKTSDSKIPCENILTIIIENVRPCIEIRKVRVARATYQVPAQISRLKGETLALRWIIEFANRKKEKDKISLAQALAFELASAYRKQGGPRQRRSELHKLAEANRSNIRYRWW